ncbi:hypothetical protein HY621_01830 [Candidatus Uhrbacteria bacterium]|nr:hypothetical protein [Candidatus Uhrbacteria bacterium]
MRQVVTLSLSPQEAQFIKTKTKQQGFDSMSAYVKYLLRADQDTISEKELIKTVRESRKEYRAGKAIKARSLADLL